MHSGQCFQKRGSWNLLPKKTRKAVSKAHGGWSRTFAAQRKAFSFIDQVHLFIGRVYNGGYHTSIPYNFGIKHFFHLELRIENPENFWARPWGWYSYAYVLEPSSGLEFPGAFERFLPPKKSFLFSRKRMISDSKGNFMWSCSIM